MSGPFREFIIDLEDVSFTPMKKSMSYANRSDDFFVYQISNGLWMGEMINPYIEEEYTPKTFMTRGEAVKNIIGEWQSLRNTVNQKGNTFIEEKDIDTKLLPHRSFQICHKLFADSDSFYPVGVINGNALGGWFYSNYGPGSYFDNKVLNTFVDKYVIHSDLRKDVALDMKQDTISTSMMGHVMNIPWRTKKSFIRAIIKSLSYELYDVYDQSKYTTYKNMIKNSNPEQIKAFVNGKNVRWWNYYIKPEIDLTTIFPHKTPAA